MDLGMTLAGFAQLTVAGTLLLATSAFSQDISPLRGHHVWLPMTGVKPQQMHDARAAGYDTILLKVHPPLAADGKAIDFGSTDTLVGQAEAKGFKVAMAILGWVGLGKDRFWDTDESGEKIPDRLDPFWPEAMETVEAYYRAVINHYKTDSRVVAYAPTWGIYGEAGFTSFTAGRSPHALARFNEWRAKQGLAALDALPDRKSGPNTEFDRFVRFRYLYMEQRFDEMVRRLKHDAGKVPVGMWQELYPVIGYLWTMVEVPSADFALYESCFPFQTNHHPEKSLAETMGFRYRCESAEQYRNYYLPLLARKRGEGQRFVGCQLSNDYVKNYGWSEERAAQIGFDRWEDEFGPYLKMLMDAPLETPRRDVLLVFPTYSAAALSEPPVHFCDAALIDVLLRMYGCQMIRCGSPRFDKMTVAEMNRFRLIIVPDAAFLMRDTYAKLKKTRAKVLLTGCFAQALDGDLTPFGQSRTCDGLKLAYYERPAGSVAVSADAPLTKGLASLLQRLPIRLDKDEAFRFDDPSSQVRVQLSCGGEPLLSTRGGLIFIHGHAFAAACHNPRRVPPKLSGSAEGSANEVDMWGPYDSADPRNAFGYALIKNILDYAGVDYRVTDPKPRALCPYLGDHLEQASISANIAYNNTAEPQKLTVRLPFKPRDTDSRLVKGRYETTLTIQPFSYVAVQPNGNDN